MKIGIICAMEKEMKLYFEIYNFKLIDDKFKIYESRYNDKVLYLTLSGVGKVNASILCEYLIEHYKIDALINSGCCGSLTDKVKILDTIIADSVSYHDFSPIRVMEEYVPDNGNIKADNNLINKTKAILENKNLNYHIGKIVSGDMFVTDSKIRDDIYSKTKALAVDMESASIGHTARINNIPFLIIRSISDFSDGNIELEEKSAYIASNIVKELIDTI